MSRAENVEKEKNSRTNVPASPETSAPPNEEETVVKSVSQVTRAEAIQFLIKEFERLYEFRRDLIQAQESRLNVYLTSVAGAIAALGISTQIRVEFIKDFPHLVPFIEFMIVFSLFVFGTITFFRLIERGLETIVVTRAINSIKIYFAQSEINDYLIPVGEREPDFASIGFLKGKRAILIGLPQIAAVVNSLIVTISFVVLFRLNWLGQSTALIWIIGFAVFATVWLSHTLIYFWRTKRAQQSFSQMVADWRDVLQKQ